MLKQTYLLSTEAARRLYDRVRELPIIDYHCHLSPKEIYEDKPFDNIGEMWLAGDHYKWRLMRAAGVSEAYITGAASWREKFQKYAEAIALAAGNPLYHWTQMELSRYFAVEKPLSGSTAEEIWNTANAVIRQRRMSPRKLISASKVEYIATTDDIIDTLSYHEKLKADASFSTIVTPSFRADNVLLIRRPDYPAYVQKLSEASGTTVKDLETFQKALMQRLDFFVFRGCHFTDVGIPLFPDHVSAPEQADRTLRRAISGEAVSDVDYAGFVGYMYVWLAAEYQKRGLIMQWHLAVQRNINARLFAEKGPDCGADSIGDIIPGSHIAALLDRMHRQNGLPQTILYTLNPAMNAQLAAIAGSFPNIRCGTAWWFCDHKRGIAEQIQNIAEVGYLGAFLGMLTDSRSFLSYARHDYFRRILCDVIGKWLEAGEYPDDENAAVLAGAVSYYNIRNLIAGIRPAGPQTQKQ